MKIRYLITLPLLAAFVPAFAQTTTTIYTDNFTNAVATVGSVSNPAGVSSTSQWYESAPSGLSVNNGALQLVNGNNAFYTYFSATPVDLSTSAGSKLDLSFDLTTSATGSSSTFKIGLFNSQANLNSTGFTRPTISTTGTGLITAGSTTQTTTTSGNPYLNWSGYYLNLNPNSAASTATSLQFAQRSSATSNSSLLTNGGSQTLLGSATLGTTGSNLLANTTYHVDFNLTYNSASSLVLNATVTNSSTQAVVDSATYTITSLSSLGGTAFDTLGLNPASSSAAPGWTLDNLAVTETTLVPEHSTYALIAGVLSLGLVAFRLRRKAA